MGSTNVSVSKLLPGASCMMFGWSGRPSAVLRNLINTLTTTKCPRPQPRAIVRSCILHEMCGKEEDVQPYGNGGRCPTLDPKRYKPINLLIAHASIEVCSLQNRASIMHLTPITKLISVRHVESRY